MNEIVKEYPADGLDIIWKPAKCIHSEVCLKALPQVYKPDEKPWIQPAGATKEQLIDQIDRCPSGALSYRLQAAETGQSAEDHGTQKGSSPATARVEVIADGPLKVEGPVHIAYGQDIRESERPVFLCRCGASENKPYCDGSHKNTGFRDPS